MKRLFLILCAAVLVACASTSTTDPRQQAVDSTYKTGVALDASITATRAAVVSGALKGADATNAVKALGAMRDSLKAAQAALKAEPATPATPAASGAAK